MVGTEALTAVKSQCKLDEDVEPAGIGESLKAWYEQAQGKKKEGGGTLIQGHEDKGMCMVCVF